MQNKTRKPIYNKKPVTIFDWFEFIIATIVFVVEMIAGSCLVVVGVIGTAVTGAVLIGIILLILAIIAIIL